MRRDKDGKRQDGSDEQGRACNIEQREAGIMARGRTTVMNKGGQALGSKEGQG